jgi:hypothetical protein
LEDLYEPGKTSSHERVTSTDSVLSFSPRIAQFMKYLTWRQAQSNFKIDTIRCSALEEVEQQREVAYEIEEERELQKPTKLKPLKYPGLHKSILTFTQTGILNGIGGYEKAWVALNASTLKKKYAIDGAHLISRTFISTEFRKTVELNKHNDNFTVSN